MPVLFKYDVNKAWKIGNTTVRKLKLFDATWRAFQFCFLPKALCLHCAFHLKLYIALTLFGHTIHVKEKSLSFLFSSPVTSFTNPRAKASLKAESSSLCFSSYVFNKKHSVNVRNFPKEELCSVDRWKEGPYNA